MDDLRRPRGSAVTLAMTIGGIVLIWPILFIVPGWVIVRRVAPDMPAPGLRDRGRDQRLSIGARRRWDRAGDGLRPTGGHRGGRPDRCCDHGLRPHSPPLAGAVSPPDPGPIRATLANERMHEARLAPSRHWWGSCCSRTGGARPPRAWSRAVGTGATSSSTSRSGRASCTATSRPRCPTSPASR